MRNKWACLHKQTRNKEVSKGASSLMEIKVDSTLLIPQQILFKIQMVNNICSLPAILLIDLFIFLRALANTFGRSIKILKTHKIILLLI